MKYYSQLNLKQQPLYHAAASFTCYKVENRVEDVNIVGTPIGLQEENAEAEEQGATTHDEEDITCDDNIKTCIEKDN